MLKLTRTRRKPSIIIDHAGERLIIRVHHTDRNNVKVALQGPVSFNIRRAELHDAKPAA